MTSSDTSTLDARVLDLAIDVALRLSLLAMLAAACFMVVRPFLVLILWATILAVALAAPFEWLARSVGRRGVDRPGHSADLFARGVTPSIGR
jgi:predicted PurR-regulated permease PerM